MQRSCAIRSVALLLTILMLLGLLPMTALAANDGATAQSGDIFDEQRGKFYSMAVGGTYDPADRNGLIFHLPDGFFNRLIRLFPCHPGKIKPTDLKARGNRPR